MIEIRFDKTKDEVALLIWFLVDHSVHSYRFTAKNKSNFSKNNSSGEISWESMCHDRPCLKREETRLMMAGKKLDL
jgi:hypothetical protein